MHEAETVEQKQEMFQTAYFLMYVKYDRKQPLQPQIEQNLAFIQSMYPDGSFPLKN